MYTNLYLFNATLWYEEFSAIPTQFDPVTDAPIFNTTKRSINLSIEPDEHIGDLLAQKGVDLIKLSVSGRFELGVLPPEIQPMREYQIVYEYQPDNILTGLLTLFPNISSRLKIEKYLGITFKGILTLEPQQI